jgi:hypothetical protein
VNAPVSPTPLRPLGLGELLDRAVTLCVKFIVPFALIQVVYALPQGVFQYFATRNFTMLLQAFADHIRAQAAGKGDASDLSAALANSNGNLGDLGWSFGLFALSFVLVPLVNGALIDATTASYFGRTPTFREAYRAGASRWLNMVGINVLYGLSGGVVYFVVVLIALFIVFAIVAVTAAAHALGIALAVLIGVVALIALLALVILVTLALQLSYFACVVERENFATAYVSGLRRVTRGVGIRRSLLVGLAYYAAIFGIGLVSFAGQGVLSGFLHSGVAGTVFVTVVSLGTAAFTTAFMTIFYFDLRVREEGLDLELAANSTLTMPAGAP